METSTFKDDISAKCRLVKVTKDEVEREKLIREILTSEDYRDNYEAVADLAKSVIDDKKFEELAFRFIWNTEEHEDTKWLFDHYREQNREEDLETLLRMIDGESGDFLPEHLRQSEIPDGYFRCPCCKRLFLIDEHSDEYGDFCQDCYQSGRCIEDDQDER